MRPSQDLCDDGGEACVIERDHRAVRGLHPQGRGGRRGCGFLFRFRALFRARLAVEHIGACHLVVLAAHQREFGLVLNVLDVEGAAAAGAARQVGDDLRGEVGDDVVHAARGGGSAAFHREKRLGQRNRDLALVEWRDGAVAADHLIARLARRGGIGDRRRPQETRLGDGFGCRRRNKRRQERHWPRTPWCCLGRERARRMQERARRQPRFCQRPTGTPRPGTLRCRGRSPGSRVVALSVFPRRVPQ